MSNSTAPHCFGDPAEYGGEQSRECKVCPHRIACGARVEAQVNTASRKAGPMPPPSAAPPPRQPTETPHPQAKPTVAYPPRSYSYGTYTQPNATNPAQPRPATYGSYHTQPSPASAIIRPARFNHSQALLPQYATYVGYDIAEVVAQRAVDLIQSCREEYARSLFEEKK